MYAIVALFRNSLDDEGFTYEIPHSYEKDIHPGMVVLVPFGKQELYGVVLSISAESLFEKTEIKMILSIYWTQKFLQWFHIELINWLTRHYFCKIHQSLWLFFPTNLIEKIEKNKFHFPLDYTSLSYSFEHTKNLTLAQKQIYDEIITSSQNQFLLFWVTGSGKTHIYIDLIQKYLSLWKQSLLLVPEIILTNQIAQRIQEVFWEEVIVIHSSVSQAKKTFYWEKIILNQAKIVIWTRSALFYPFVDLGIIIVDEEHDSSYISDNSPRYDAIEVAMKLSNIYDCKLLLSSGTPKINHMYAWLQWNLQVLNLLEDFTNT